MSISDKAIDAAARAAYEDVRPRMGFPSGFDGAPEPLQDTYRSIAHAALEAVLPHLLADAWAEGHIIGRVDEWSLEPNPYRPTP